MLKLNAQTAIDFYKAGHKDQYPEGTELVFSNYTARSDKYAVALPDFDHKVVWFGIQVVAKALLIDFWDETFFNRPKDEVVAYYKRRIKNSLGIADPDVSHIAALHDVGYLPISLKSLPEGSRVNIRVPLFTLRNTIPEFFWITNFLETQIMAEIWKIFTSATTAYEFRRLFEKYAGLTGGNKDFVLFQGHDFSMRGLCGLDDSAMSGMGHLLSFKGTDTVSAIDAIEFYYDPNNVYQKDNAPMIGASIPATEHSVMCMWGNVNELKLFEHLLTNVYPNGLFSAVSDTWDFWKVITEYTVALKDVITGRDGKIVFRPDSGDPADIVCGTARGYSQYETMEKALEALEKFNNNVDEDKGESFIDMFEYKGRYFIMEGMEDDYTEVVGSTDDEIDDEGESVEDEDVYPEDYGWVEVKPTPEMMGAVQCLWNIFSGTTNDLGFRTIDQHVGMIYGDSINLKRAEDILERLKNKGFASDNIVFGIGSYTYQGVTRDTYGTAMKATFGRVYDEYRELYKEPKTDSGTKKSARGLVRVEKEGDDFVLYDQQNPNQEKEGALREILVNGKLVVDECFETIRQRLYPV